MAFFKSVRELNKQSREMQRNWDVGATLANAQASMAAASASMARQTAAAGGLEAAATVVAIRQGGAMINFQPLVEIDLTVMAPGAMPYPATVSQVVPQVHLARVQPGAPVRVKVAETDPGAVWIDFA